MGRTLVAKNGNDKVMTPPELGARIIEHFNPQGWVLEPCKGDGKGFYEPLKAHLNKTKGNRLHWCEIERGVDFFNYEHNVDWIITNPPYSLYSKFLEHSLRISDNIVFLYLIPGLFYKKRVRLLKEYGFGIKEIIYIDTPKSFPQFGFQIGVVHYARGIRDNIQITDWTL